MTDDCCLADLLGLNLHNFEDEVHNVVDKAVKEMAMEKMLRDLESTWTSMEFVHELHARTGCNLLRFVFTKYKRMAFCDWRFAIGFLPCARPFGILFCLRKLRLAFSRAECRSDITLNHFC